MNIQMVKKLFRTRLFYIFLLLSLALGIYSGISIKSTYELNLEYYENFKEIVRENAEAGSEHHQRMWEAIKDEKMSFYGIIGDEAGVPLIAVTAMMLLFAVYFITGEFKNGTYKNKLTAGYRKSGVVLASFLVALLSSVLFLAFFIIPYLLTAQKALICFRAGTLAFFILVYFCIVYSFVSLCIVLCVAAEKPSYVVLLMVLCGIVMFAYVGMFSLNLENNTSAGETEPYTQTGLIEENGLIADAYENVGLPTHRPGKERTSEIKRDILVEKAVIFSNPVGLWYSTMLLTDVAEDFLSNDLWKKVPRDRYCYESELAANYTYFPLFAFLQVLFCYALASLVFSRKNLT